MKYADVAVNSPGSRSGFCYAIPSQLSVGVGQAVWVPFGTRILQGIVLKLSDHPSVASTREITDVITPHPLLLPIQIQLAGWISERYLCSLFDAIALMLPPGFERKVVTFLEPATSVDEADLSILTAEQRQLLGLIQRRGKVRLSELRKRFGERKVRLLIEQLLHRYLVVKSRELGRVRVRPKLVTHLELMLSRAEAEVEAIRLKGIRAYRQAAVIEFLAGQTEPVPLAEVRKFTNCPRAVIGSLRRRGFISVTEIEVRRDPLSHISFAPALPPTLTSAQEAVLQSLRPRLIRGGGNSSVFLLFGVTGSGKTEIYLRALAEVIASGRRGICLVPEIALTPQTIERFVSRFPGRVAVLHSGLSLGEQFDEWRRIREGDCDVVIGPRGTLFAPQPDLGLIVIDEEHEGTYKQQDKSPRYQTRDVAIKLAELTGAVVILGSATPDVETFYRAQAGKYRLVELEERISPRGPTLLPEVEIIDLRKELKAGNSSLFSRSLTSAMAEALARGEQIILFLNRRGTSTFVQCRNCGFVFRCSRCSVALTYHSAHRKLICHHCGYTIPTPKVCPQCFSTRLKFLGIGTQKVEEEVRRLFPESRLLRWDRDVTVKRYSHERFLSDFREHKADILIGTQMVAKGLDLPQITLAAVVNADTGLNLPDFRVGERTFQLLCQVAGRAGRGLSAGKVIIQTYTPEHYAIQAASGHDYLAFYSQEIDYRRQYGYPPFSRLARLVYSHTNALRCQRQAESLSQIMVEERDRRGIPNLSLIGPVPAFVPRLRGRFRWQIILRGADPASFLADMPIPQGWTVDIDPVGLA